jgi:hypothetical protein
VVAGSTCQENHALDLLGITVTQPDFGRRDVCLFTIEAASESVLERSGLFEDLLQHEMLVPGLLGHHRRPGDLSRASREWRAIELR